MSLYSKDEETFQNTKTWLFNYLGRLLIGGNTRKEFVVFVGEKDSGKTTFVTLLSEILGTYTGMVQDEILMGKDSDQLHRMLYELKDKRLLLHSEGTNKRNINTQTLKRITGGSEYSLRDDISFIIRGKIMEDTNYIPFPDNENDAAFNDRIIIIPFLRNTMLPRERIAEIVKRLNDCKVSIFTFMVRMTCRGIFTKPEKPTCSIEVKRQLDIIRNPVKQFYSQVVDNVVPEHTNTLGTALSFISVISHGRLIG
jgi:phage/plasmid-associated DNA primase